MRGSKNISISLLYRKFIRMPLSDADQQLFDSWYDESEEHRLFYNRFCLQQEKIMTRDITPINVEKHLSDIKYRRQKRVRLAVRKLSTIVATIIIVFAFGWIYWTNIHDLQTTRVTKAETVGTSVTLQLGNGDQIILDSIFMAQTMQPDSLSLRIYDDHLEYFQDSNIGEELIYNKLCVPPTMEFMVVLADGTKVYLNSSSSLSYPTMFPTNERKVYLSGEAYFVVTEGESPFIVETLLNEVKVFGTEFNIMTYENETEEQTTLVSGSISVLAKKSHSLEFQKIIPGEQFRLNRETGQSEIVAVNVYPYIAWKSGLIVSQDEDLETILRRIARWYDVTILYQNPELKRKRFFGIMKRQISLHEILEVIAKAGDVQFEVRDKIVTVLDKNEGKLVK